MLTTSASEELDRSRARILIYATMRADVLMRLACFTVKCTFRFALQFRALSRAWPLGRRSFVLLARRRRSFTSVKSRLRARRNLSLPAGRHVATPRPRRHF